MFWFVCGDVDDVHPVSEYYRVRQIHECAVAEVCASFEEAVRFEPDLGLPLDRVLGAVGPLLVVVFEGALDPDQGVPADPEGLSGGGLVLPHGHLEGVREADFDYAGRQHGAVDDAWDGPVVRAGVVLEPVLVAGHDLRVASLLAHWPGLDIFGRPEDPTTSLSLERNGSE